MSVAIIGGGASGTLVAVQLLRQARAPLHVRLFERMSEVGRGVAYGTACPEHLLNVPAGRMGAFPGEPGHFLQWLGGRTGTPGYPERVTAADFVPRWIYGDYLQAVLADAVRSAAPGVELEVVKAEVVEIESGEGEVRLRCGGGRSYEAGRVVLAIGNLPGEYPVRRPLRFYSSTRYVHVPWPPGALAGIPPDADVLLVGAGLTATDLILALRAQGHRGVIHALSRRGLLPRAHVAGPAYHDFLAGRPEPTTIRELLRLVRVELERAAESGHDWRAVLDALRPRTPALWQALSWEERARFMRHLRPLWDAHRHRVAPVVAEKIEALRQARRVRFYAGRLSDLRDRGPGVEAQFNLRGSGRTITLRVAKVINCTGPRTDYSKYQHPLLLHLLANGLIDHDPLALGLRATPAGQVLDHNGRIVDWLFTLGAPLKGDLWECTAMPEIRAQAQTVAAGVLNRGGA